jgi:phosphotransferase system HPr (HPr) family protein
MSESKATRSVVVTDPAGVHARTAVAIAQAVRRGKSRVTLTKGQQQVEATDVLPILMMVAAQGERVDIEAVGPDAAAVVDSLLPLFAGQFGDEAPKSGL